MRVAYGGEVHECHFPRRFPAAWWLDKHSDGVANVEGWFSFSYTVSMSNNKTAFTPITFYIKSPTQRL